VKNPWNAQTSREGKKVRDRGREKEKEVPFSNLAYCASERKKVSISGEKRKETEIPH